MIRLDSEDHRNAQHATECALAEQVRQAARLAVLEWEREVDLDLMIRPRWLDEQANVSDDFC